MPTQQRRPPPNIAKKAAYAFYEDNDKRELKRQQLQAQYDSQYPQRIYNSFSDATWIIVFLATCVIAVFFFIFAFQNPDPKDCFFYPGVEVPEKEPGPVKVRALELNLAIVQGYPVNMGHIYKIWFKWGFFTYAAALSLSFIGKCTESAVSALGAFRDVLLGCLGVSLCLNFLAFTGLGLMWRFSESGYVVSGERLVRTKEMLTDEQLWRETLEEAAHEKGYQLQGGNLMKVYFFFVLPIMLGTSFILGIVGMLLKPDSDLDFDWTGSGDKDQEENQPLMQDDEERQNHGKKSKNMRYQQSLPLGPPQNDLIENAEKKCRRQRTMNNPSL